MAVKELTCAEMLMHAIAHGGCTDTVRESAPEADSGRKIPCRTWDSNPQQYYAWLFSQTLYQQSYPGLGDNTVSIFQLHLRQFTFRKRIILNVL